jgi:hypothetical protein
MVVLRRVYALISTARKLKIRGALNPDGFTDVPP